MECGKAFESAILCDDGTFPNNPEYCAVIYRNVFSREEPGSENFAEGFEELFNANMWGNGWRNGVYDFHHYHSTAHEVLGIYSGSAELKLGGEKGILSTVTEGDAVLIPAGVAHKKISTKGNFKVVGAYPFGQVWDMCYGRPRSLSDFIVLQSLNKGVRI